MYFLDVFEKERNIVQFRKVNFLPILSNIVKQYVYLDKVFFKLKIYYII